MGMILNCCPEVSTCHQHRGLGLSSEDCSCWKRKEILLFLFLVIHSRIFILWTLLKTFESWRRRRSVYGWSENCIHFQVRTVLVNISILMTGHPLVSMSWAPKFESTTFRISNLTCWYGDIKACSRRFLKSFVTGPATNFNLAEDFHAKYCHVLEKILYSQSN